MSIGTFDGYRRLQLNVSARSSALPGVPDNARQGGRPNLLVGPGPSLWGTPDAQARTNRSGAVSHICLVKIDDTSKSCKFRC